MPSLEVPNLLNLFRLFLSRSLFLEMHCWVPKLNYTLLKNIHEDGVFSLTAMKASQGFA